MTQVVTNPVRLAFGGLIVLAAAMGIGRFVFTPILPEMVSGVPLSAEDAGWIAAGNYLGYLLGALAGSLVKLPVSRRTTFLAGLLASAATSALMGVGSGVWFFTLIRFLSGVASAYALVAISGLVLQSLGRLGRPGLSALFFSGVGFGISFSALSMSWMIALGLPWNALWYVSGACTLAAAVASGLLIPASADQPLAAAGTAASSSDEPAEPRSKLILVILGYGLFGFGYVVTMTFISLIARQDPALAALEKYLWLIVGLSAAPSIYIWNRIANPIGMARALALACFLEAVGVALSVTTHSMPIMVTAAMLVGGTFMGITALGLAQAQRLSTGDTTQIIAIMTTSFGVGQMVGPWAAGYLHSLTGSFLQASLMAAGALLIAAVLALFVRRSPERRTRQG